MTATPPVRRRLLGAALRRYRENLGFRLEEAARILDCDRSKISRIETGQRGISAKELRELLTEYGVPDGEQAALLAVAHRGRQHGWWQGYQNVLSDAGQDYVIMEPLPRRSCVYDVQPGARLAADAGLRAGGGRRRSRARPRTRQRAQAVEVKLARQRVRARRAPPAAGVRGRRGGAAPVGWRRGGDAAATGPARRAGRRQHRARPSPACRCRCCRSPPELTRRDPAR